MANLPSDMTTKQEFAYSICESIDYQIESFPQQDEETKPVQQEIQISRDELMKVLNLEKKQGS